MVPESIEQTHLSKAATRGLTAVLGGEEMEKLWGRHHHALRNNNPALLVAEDLQSLEGNITEHPALLSFVRELVVMEKAALGKGSSQEDMQLGKELNGLINHLDNISVDIDVPSREELPRSFQKLLNMIENQTAQKPFRPIHAFAGVVKHLGKHMWHDAKEHPKSFAALLGVSLSALAFMNRNIGGSKDYLDPALIGLTDLDVDVQGNVVDFVSSLDPNEAIGMKVGCHDHLEQMIGQNGADFVKDTLDMAGLFPQDCGLLKTKALEAQNTLKGGYDWVNERLGWFTADPANALAEAMPDSHFVRAFNEAAQSAAEHVYAFDAVENVVVHSLLFGSAFIAGRKCALLTHSETMGAYQKAHDFIYRTAVNSPLSYIFGGAAATHSWISNSGFSPESLWMGIGGALAGHFTHKAARVIHRADHVRRITAPAKAELAQFTDVEAIISDKRAGERLSVNNVKKHWFDLKTKVAAAFAAASTATVAVAADMRGNLETLTNETMREFLTTASDVTGYVAGKGFVWGSYVLVNIPQDTTLHLIFGVAGGALGLAYGASERGARKVGRIFRGPKGPDDPSL